MFCRKKILPIIGFAEDLSLQKILGLQIANLQMATFAEGPLISQILEVRKFAVLQFAELTCG
jgi:hypothetical protein